LRSIADELEAVRRRLRRIKIEMSIERNDLTVKWIRRIARTLSVIILGIALVLIIGHIVVPEPTEADYPPIENLLPVIMFLSVLGLGISWRWEGLGGAISVGFFVVHLALYWAIRKRFFPLRVLVVLSPVLLTGILFLVCWWRSRGSQNVA
jgi:hypothetical protein